MKEIKDLKLKPISSLKDLSKEDLKKELFSAEKNMYDLRMKMQLNEFKQTHLIKFLRRYIAAINTVISSQNV